MAPMKLAAWGQMLPMLLKAGIAVANEAESGETLNAFVAEKRLAGDYLFIQFGHNDMKEHGDGIGPFTSYTKYLESYIQTPR